MKKKALIMVDLQNDFCTGGNLAVPRGEEVVPLANALQAHFDSIVATKDWHPANHLSFASQHPGKKVGEVENTQVLWPDHCVQESRGAEFHPALETQHIHKIIFKGTDRQIDSYSAFFDNAHLRATGLGDYLRAQQVAEVYIMGLATDYCVKYSVLDAVELGFKVFLVKDACRGVELRTGDTAMAIAEMEAAGVRFVRVREILKQEQSNLLVKR